MVHYNARMWLGGFISKYQWINMDCHDFMLCWECETSAVSVGMKEGINDSMRIDSMATTCGTKVRRGNEVLDETT